MDDSSSSTEGSEFFDASDIAEIPVPPSTSKDGVRERSKSGSKKHVPPLGKLDKDSLAKVTPRAESPIPVVVHPPAAALGRASNSGLRSSGEGTPSPALTPRARLRATDGPGRKGSSRRHAAHGNSGGDHSPYEDNSLATDISIDDLASLAAEGDEEVYLTDLATGELYSLDQLRKKGDADAGLYAKGKLLLVGKGKTIKSLLQSVDTSMSTQKAKVLRRIDSLTSREDGEMPRSPSGAGVMSAAPTLAAASKPDPKVEKTSIFRKFSKDAVSSKKDRDATPPAAASPQKISLMNIPVRNPAPKLARKHKQKRKIIGAIRVLDEITVHKGAVWVIKFSHDNRLLASGGHDMILRIWKVRDSLRDFRLLEPTPVCTFIGHAGDILDVAWSKAQFILSSSMDKTVRLWHVTRDDCLYVFNHDDFVTSVAFHPTNDRLFLTGCLDKKLRLWSIPDKAVKEWKDVGGFVTAATFTPNGRTAIAATYDGKCTFYEGDTLRWITQVNADPKAKGSAGKKITGLEILPGGSKLLITSNDSRLRLYHLSDYSLVCTYKGLVNNSYQIRASFSDDGKYVISGSEDHATYLWDTEPQQNTWAPYINPLRTSRQDKSDAYESFETQSEGSTLVSIFVPQALYASQIEGCDDANSDRLIVTADTFGTIKVWFTRPDAGTAAPPP